MSTISWREHNELKYLEIRPCAPRLAVKPTAAEWRVGYSCGGLRAPAACLRERKAKPAEGQGVPCRFLRQTRLYQFKEKKENAAGIVSSAPADSVWQTLPPCCVFTVSRAGPQHPHATGCCSTQPRRSPQAAVNVTVGCRGSPQAVTVPCNRGTRFPGPGRIHL